MKKPNADLFLRQDWEDLFGDLLEKVDALEAENFIVPFVAGGSQGREIKMYSIEMFDSAVKMLEKDITPEDIERFNILLGLSVSQKPEISIPALKLCVDTKINAQLGGQTTVTTDERSVETVVRDVTEQEIFTVPQDQLSLFSENTGENEENSLSESPETTVTESSDSTTMVNSKSEDETICSILQLDETIFAPLFKSMKNNFVYNGVEYGKTNTKAKGDMMSRGILPSFNNFRVATAEEINLFLILREGNIELPENLEALILERCAARSKRTTGKWQRKKRGIEEGTAPEPENLTIDDTMPEVVIADVDTTQATTVSETTNAEVIPEENDANVEEEIVVEDAITTMKEYIISHLDDLSVEKLQLIVETIRQ